MYIYITIGDNALSSKSVFLINLSASILKFNKTVFPQDNNDAEGAIHIYVNYIITSIETYIMLNYPLFLMIIVYLV